MSVYFIENMESAPRLANFTVFTDETKLAKYSSNVLLTSKRVNIFLTCIVVFIGLIGNFLTFFVLSQKKNRINSTHVYLLCLAVSDSLFLVIHFFEDTMRSYADFYMDENVSVLFRLLNIIDHFEISCRLINYLRYSIRFISTYIVVIFCLQRLFLFYKPFSTNFKSKKSAWKTVKILISIAFVLNTWVPFFFQINFDDLSQQTHCDIKTKLKSKYFKINIAYISVVLLLPIVLILVSNLLILARKIREDINHKSLRIISTHSNMESSRLNNQQAKQKLNYSTSETASKLHYLTFEQLIVRAQPKPQRSCRKITKMIVFLSITFIILNLPYLFAWIIFIFQTQYRKNQYFWARNYLYGLLQITEIINLSNCGIKFFVYSASGYKFNKQIKYTSSEMIRINFEV